MRHVRRPSERCVPGSVETRKIPYAWVCRTFITTNGTEVIVRGFMPESRRFCCRTHAPSEVFRLHCTVLTPHSAVGDVTTAHRDVRNPISSATRAGCVPLSRTDGRIPRFGMRVVRIVGIRCPAASHAAIGSYEERWGNETIIGTMADRRSSLPMNKPKECPYGRKERQNRCVLTIKPACYDINV